VFGEPVVVVVVVVVREGGVFVKCTQGSMYLPGWQPLQYICRIAL
jgi:hypothetical protein